MFRFLTAGESHGPCLTAIIEGIPAGLELSEKAINFQLQRRQRGYGRGKRMELERDRVKITSGVRGGFTLGSPICLVIENKDWENWQDIMAADKSADLEAKKVTAPRPGHADLAGAIKYRHKDMRNVLERASARETAARVAVGAVARIFLEALGININSHVIRIGNVAIDINKIEPHMLSKALDSPVMCIDSEKAEEMLREIDNAKREGDSLGGIFEVIAENVPPGLGSYAHWDRRLDGRLAQALMSIPGVKGVEFGIGFKAAEKPGSEVHDAIYYNDDRGFYRLTNNAGGLEGGMSNGEPIIARAAMKPIPTLIKSLPSVDIRTKKPVKAAVERSDVCAVPAAAVVGEAVVSIVLAEAVLEKFGGDYMEEIFNEVARYRGYERQV
ncbi:MAG: Chorismate synthase [Clostridia bacterium 41_269]|nr:MAG: Chorismate synthase [Clostridia bacterium 41_269]